MKIEMKTLAILLMFVLITACTSNSRTELLNNSSYKKIANDKLEKMVMYIANKDTDSIKSLFSERVLNESTDFDDKLTELFEFVEGEVISWEASSGPTVFEARDSGKTTREVDSYYYVTTDVNKYFIIINDFQIDEVNASNQGINMFLVVLSDDRLEVYKPENEILYKNGDKIRPSGLYLPIN